MKHFLILIFFSLITSIKVMSQFNFTFPEKWTKDFKVEVTDNGGMLDHELSIRITYDSVIYTNRVQSKKEKNSFTLNEKQRTEIFAQLKKLKSDPIGSVVVTLDKGTSTIELHNSNGIFAASDDTDNEEIRRDFHEVFNYLVNFAKPIGRKKQ